MKKLLSILLCACMLLSVFPAGAESEPLAEDDEDDSIIIPVDLPEEEDPMAAEASARSLQYGDEGDDVLFLQTRLQDLGYYSGNLSGRYREGTRDAVMRFQQDYGLTADGVADPQSQVIIFTAVYRPLSYGSKGEDVKELQTRLTALGYYKGQISGNFLEATRAAISAFQEKNGIEATGIADPETQEALFTDWAVGNYDSPTETPSPVPDLNNYLVDEDENRIPLPDNPVQFVRKLKNGSSGAPVKQLQGRLRDLGYLDASKVSGNFQKYTTRAVKAFQTQNGMEATGVVDETTWNLIFNDSQIVLPDDTPKPTPSPSPIPFHIVVDVKNQITSVYGRDEDGNYTVPVRQMLCSTGKVGTPSDVGDWVLSGRKATWCNFPKWGGYARYWTKINASIAFHSVIYTAVNNRAVKVSSYYALGGRASHGCIRLTVADAKWIYDNVGAGTVVTIREDLPADPELKRALRLPGFSTKDMMPIRTPTPTPEPVYNSQVKPELGNRTLKEKTENEDVFWVQNRLKELGYYTTKCTGIMLARTIQAVKDFQRDHDMTASGTVNQAVIDAMYEAKIPDPTPRPTPSPYPPEPTPKKK